MRHIHMRVTCDTTGCGGLFDGWIPHSDDGVGWAPPGWRVRIISDGEVNGLIVEDHRCPRCVAKGA